MRVRVNYHDKCLLLQCRVLNTDNMSVLGLTIDYGPYGFMDQYSPSHICNESGQLSATCQCLSIVINAEYFFTPICYDWILMQFSMDLSWGKGKGILFIRVGRIITELYISDRQTLTSVHTVNHTTPWYCFHLGGQIPQKPLKKGMRIGIFKPYSQNIKTGILSKLLHQF